MTTPHRPRTFTQLIAAVGVLLLATAGCGIRVGQPPAPIPSPGTAEVARQYAAIAMERVLLATQESPTRAPGGLDTVATQYLESLGGVWLAPGREENPSPASPALDHDNSDLLGVVEEAAEAMLEHARSDSSAPTEAYASMWLSLHTAAASLRGQPAPKCVIPCGTELIPPALLATAAGSEAPEVLDLLEAVRLSAPELIAVYDGLGYFEEIRAARSSLDERDALAAGASELRSFADLLAGPAAGSETDPRRSAYRFDAEDLDASIWDYAHQAVHGWVSVLAVSPPNALELAKSAAWHAYGTTNPSLLIEPWPGLADEN